MTRDVVLAKEWPKMRLRALIAGTAMVVASVAHAGQGPSGLKLTLRIGHDRYAPYEPVVLEYQVENRGSAAADVPGSVDISRGLIRFEVAGTSGKFHEYRTGPVACGFTSKESLAPAAGRPGQVIIVSNQLAELLGVGEHPGDHGLPLPFATAGSYRIRARFAAGGSFTDKDSVIQSDDVTLTVRAATERERDAIAFFESPAELSVALGGESAVQALSPGTASNDRASEPVQRWEDFVARFGDTVYAPFVRMRLAKTYRRGGQSLAPRPDLAIDHLVAVVRTGPPSIVDDALVELAKAYIEANNSGNAESAVSKLLDRFPSSENAADARRIRDGLRAGHRTLAEIFGN